MTLAELLATRNQGTSRFPGFSLTDLLARRNEPLDAKFNPSGVGPGVSYGSLASILTDFAPGIGDAKSAVDAVKEAQEGNWGMSLLDAFGALPMVGGMGAIKAFHGSPHKFDAFDMSKIGTGEGAQAYGHGLYFAENPSVATDYARANLSGPAQVAYVAGKSDGSAIEALRTIYPGMPKDWYDSAIRKANEQGNLYETSLEWPDPAREAADPLGPQHFLDWDKPLSRDVDKSQQEAINKLMNSRPDILDKFVSAYKEGEPGWYYYSLLNDAAKTGDLVRNQAAATEALQGAGIPGIRYLDQGSRGAGDGTYNYVVFDDKIPRIVSRNGEAVASGPTLASLDRRPTEFEEAHRIAQRNAALPLEQGGLGLPTDNTAADRAKAMGFDTEAYHGTKNDFAKFDRDRVKENYPYSFGIHTTSRPSEASVYASHKLTKMADGGNVMPLLLRSERPLNISTDQVSASMEADLNRYAIMDELLKAKNDGNPFDSVVINRNRGDEWDGSNYVALDPRNIRSRFAAFDPMRRDSANILAGSLLGGLGLNALLGGYDYDR